MKKITKETLKKWGACYSGAKRFNELFPEGETLRNASEGLIADGHNDWANWLWSQCKQDNDYIEQTIATAGDWGTAAAGNEGTATAGYRGTATAGYRGTATAGDCGVISILYYNGERYVRKIGIIAENGLKPNTKYIVENGDFKEVSE